MINILLNNIALSLSKQLPWLTHSYGKAYRLIDAENNLYPAIHTDNTEYISLLPNDSLGNYLFFELKDPQWLTTYTQDRFVSKFKVDLIVWFNLESIYGPITDNVLSDDIKSSIILALANRFHPGANIEIVEIYESAENIFKNYSLKQVNTQFLMLPYYGFRFVLNIIEKIIC